MATGGEERGGGPGGHRDERGAIRQDGLSADAWPVPYPHCRGAGACSAPLRGRCGARAPSPVPRVPPSRHTASKNAHRRVDLSL